MQNLHLTAKRTLDHSLVFFLLQSRFCTRVALVHVLDASVMVFVLALTPAAVDLVKLHKWALFDNFHRTAVNL